MLLLVSVQHDGIASGVCVTVRQTVRSFGHPIGFRHPTNHPTLYPSVHPSGRPSGTVLPVRPASIRHRAPKQIQTVPARAALLPAPRCSRGAMGDEVDWGGVKQEEEHEEVKEEVQKEDDAVGLRKPPPGWPAARALAH